MDRATRCRNAASTVLSIVRRRLSSKPALRTHGAPAIREALQGAEGEIQDVLYTSFADKAEHAIDDLLDEARRHEQNVRITGYDPKEDDPAFRSTAERLGEAMRRGLEELEELTGHVCSFSEDPDTGHPSCPVCGNSGLI
ncbi:hypothetical protein GBA63_22415 (plasmid) [Rubrobacter tropicus]|uniref:Uncharacterized protein n=1 Tax=Rubrobacter tropicus TaxID=2653851 RepID=A0A6G8QG75_9ACTN|nr:hypothetical protein [Rubrobacter tropicus]QIN85458.1 hypothetical protein GBA63_22415 [Rubrobacter tropicus]